MTVVRITDQACSCTPWQVSWRPETPGWCATCGRPFNDGKDSARAVCLRSEGCLLLPDHEGDCDTGTERE